MNITVILVISVIVQLAASIFALKLIKVTGKRTAWMLISVAVTLMSLRRLLTLYHIFFRSLPVTNPDPLTEIVALVSSTFTLLGVLYIGPIFSAIKKAQADLKASEEKYRNIVETSLEGIWVTDALGMTAYTNRRMAQMLGFTAQELLNLKFSDLVEKGISSRQFEDPERPARERNEVSEAILVKKNGSTLYAIASKSPLLDAEGKYIGMLQMFTDITERKKIEIALRQKEELVRRVLESLPVGVWITEKDGKIIHVNPAGLKIWGGAKFVGLENYGEYRGRSLITGKRVEPQEWPLARAVTKGETVLNEEIEIECFDGMKKIILNSAVPLMDAENNISGAIVVDQDITERKKLEDLLQQERDRMINILNSMGDGIYISDEGYDIIYVNPVFGKEFGPVGGKCYEYFHGLKEKCPFCKNREVFNGKTIRWEWFFEKNRKTYDIINTPLKNKDGSVSNLGICRDITERKKAEEVLKRDKDTFEKLVSEKTEELLAAKVLLDKQKQLSTIGTLAATVAHELRNPLGVIRTASYNIRRKDPNTSIQPNLDNIDKKVMEADQIITNLLFYSRIKLPHFETVSVYEILEECVEATSNKYHKSQVSLAKKYGDIKDSFVEIDPLQFREVFNNMLNNAFESFCGKKGEVEISASLDSGGNKMCINFKDNGIGMSPQELIRISEPFFTTKSRGTGLGLTVCYQIIDLHGGNISVESVKEKGSTFTIIFPITRHRV
ncbi:MAG: PAS domain S-box protein [Candidatus Omnitrophica bacterium]|nr:PAS domain S-box protein [Candidatus Omnitrophota bacterium]